jgi:hypothetical protein
MKIEIELLRGRFETQCREAIDSQAVEEYAEAMRGGEVFPPVEVFQDGTAYLLGDGFHRVEAAYLAGFTEIEANVRQGGMIEAIRYALNANSRHGLRRTHADIARAVRIAYDNRIALGLGEVPSARAVAKMIGCSHHTVASQLGNLPSWADSETRMGADGKERRLPESNPENPVDACGVPIPEHAIAIFERRGEVVEMLDKIAKIRNKIEIADSLNDPLFKQCRTEGILLDISKVYRHIAIALPQHVCPWCGGTGCSQCRTTGMVSSYVWSTAPQKLKDKIMGVS